MSVDAETTWWREASLALNVTEYLQRVGDRMLDALGARSLIVRLLDDHQLVTLAAIRKGVVGVTHPSHPTSELTITTDAAALCKSKSSPAEMTIHVPAMGKMPYVVCGGFQGSSFKYTATIAGSLPEDPIIIIEKSGFLTPVILTGLAAAGGLILGLLISKFLARRGMSSPS